MNPIWNKTFEVPYQFEQRSQYRVEVYDAGDFEDPDNLAGHDMLGYVEFEMNTILSSPSQTYKSTLGHKVLKKGKKTHES